MRVSRIIFTDLNAGVLPSPFRGCKRTHTSLLCLPWQTGQGCAEGQQLSTLCNCFTLPSTVIAVLIALLPNNTQTLQGTACARVLSHQAIPTPTPRVWGVGEGNEEAVVCRAARCRLASGPDHGPWLFYSLDISCASQFSVDSRAREKLPPFTKNKCLFNVLQE